VLKALKSNVPPLNQSEGWKPLQRDTVRDAFEGGSQPSWLGGPILGLHLARFNMRQNRNSDAHRPTLVDDGSYVAKAVKERAQRGAMYDTTKSGGPIHQLFLAGVTSDMKRRRPEHKGGSTNFG
jgi:hypothetical protein